MSTMGVALRHLVDEDNRQGVEVMTKFKDFNIMTVANQKGEPVDVSADTLVTFTAGAFREIKDDIWEFRTASGPEDGPSLPRLIYLRGEDILLVRTTAQVT